MTSKLTDRRIDVEQPLLILDHSNVQYPSFGGTFETWVSVRLMVNRFLRS